MKVMVKDIKVGTRSKSGVLFNNFMHKGIIYDMHKHIVQEGEQLYRGTNEKGIEFTYVREWFDIIEEQKGEEMNKLKVDRIIFNDPATIVIWSDGSKTVVKLHNEPFDKEKGVAMAFMRKMFTRSEFNKLVKNAYSK